jgi:hypothetical protein
MGRNAGMGEPPRCLRSGTTAAETPGRGQTSSTDATTAPGNAGSADTGLNHEEKASSQNANSSPAAAAISKMNSATTLKSASLGVTSLSATGYG